MAASSLGFMIGAVLAFAGAAIILYWYMYWERHFQGELLTGGPYAYVRHPYYTGFLLLATGLVLLWPGYEMRILFVMTMAVLTVFIPKEEAQLLTQYQNEYMEYMNRVKHRLIPGVY